MPNDANSLNQVTLCLNLIFLIENKCQDLKKELILNKFAVKLLKKKVKTRVFKS